MGTKFYGQTFGLRVWKEIEIYKDETGRKRIYNSETTPSFKGYGIRPYLSQNKINSNKTTVKSPGS